MSLHDGVADGPDRKTLCGWLLVAGFLNGIVLQQILQRHYVLPPSLFVS
ncbi:MULTISPECIES: hypothetical protein [unclassified Mesorhizobium]|nr:MULTISPECIES: hypothetical protein [unclassified Mesorhizobium]